MIRAIISRIKQGHRTLPYPAAPLQMPERFRGYPVAESIERTKESSNESNACPYGALLQKKKGVWIWANASSAPSVRQET